MDGIVNILKPPGMTSSNVVFDVRRIYGEKRAGHLGTLDPAAAGVLPVCLGRATKLFDLLVDKDKTPRWRPASLDEVTPALLENLMKPPFAGKVHPLADLGRDDPG